MSMSDYETAQIVIKSRNGIYKIVKSRFEHVESREGRYLSESDMVDFLNSSSKVAICNLNGSIIEKNFKGVFDL